MARVRLGVFFIGLVIVGLMGLVVSFYARGYRFEPKTFKFIPNGLLVVNSEPTGAQIWVDGELASATNATIPLPPAEYDIEVKKDGYISWKKRLTVEKEIVTQADVSLFPAAPTLTPITFSGVLNPIASPDGNKIAYIVPNTRDNLDKSGLWISEVINLPIGFPREPRRITDGDLSQAFLEWSPDSKEILLTTSSGVYLLDTGQLTSQPELVNIAATLTTIKAQWNERQRKITESKLDRLPDELADIFQRKTDNIVFSPDDRKILYTASASVTIPQDLVPQLPGSSTQKQVRDIKGGKKYVYDIKEDRNFEVGEATQPIYWLPSSMHLIIPSPNQVAITDYDGTNKQTVYSGSYVSPHAYAFTNTSKLLILTNFGSDNSLPNLYSLNLK